MWRFRKRRVSTAGTGGEGYREYGGAGLLSVVGVWRGAATVSVGPAAFSSPRPLPGLPRARPLTALVPSRAQRVPSYRTRKTRKPLLIFAGCWQLGLECLREGGVTQLSGGPSPLYMPPSLVPATSFRLLLIFPPRFFTPPSPLIYGYCISSLECCSACSSGHHFLASGGGSILYQKILYQEGLKSNKLALLQLALMGLALSLVIRQLGEVLDLLVAFWAPKKAPTGDGIPLHPW